MSDSGKFVQIPEEDEFLLVRLESYTIENFPNPERHGCPPREVLAKFVAHPSEVPVADLNDLHILRCAECTSDLRRLRVERQSRATIGDPEGTHSWWWIAAAAALLLCIAIPIHWHRRASYLRSAPPYVADIVLDNQSTERGPAVGLQLPRRMVLLHITLPSGEFAETYRVTLAKNRTMVDPVAQTQASSQVTVSGLRITARLDLSSADSGGYWIGVGSTEKPDTWFTFVELK